MWWIGYTKSGREAEVADAIRALGAFAWWARKVEPKRVPTKRRPVAVTSPYLANYVFIDCSDAQWHGLRDVKHLAHTLQSVAQATADRQLRPFMAEVDAAYEARVARIAAGERVEAFQPGERLRILEGPLRDQLVRFDGIVRGATDIEDRLRARLPLLGGWVPVMLDPLHVGSADVNPLDMPPASP